MASRIFLKGEEAFESIKQVAASAVVDVLTESESEGENKMK